MLGLQRQHADVALAVADRALHGVDDDVARADAQRALPADPAVGVRGGAVGAVVEAIAAQRRAKLFIGGDAVAIDDLVVHRVVQGDREGGRFVETIYGITQHACDVASAGGGADRIAHRVRQLTLALGSRRSGRRDARCERAVDLGAEGREALLDALIERRLEREVDAADELVEALRGHRGRGHGRRLGRLDRGLGLRVVADDAEPRRRGRRGGLGLGLGVLGEGLLELHALGERFVAARQHAHRASVSGPRRGAASRLRGS